MAREALNTVRKYILDGLAKGALSEGQKLPAERKLAEELGMTRATVRQALDILESSMLVSRHVGRGTYITSSARHEGPVANEAYEGEASMAPASEDLDASPGQLMQARLVIEPHITELVVITAQESDLKRLRHIAEAQRSVTHGDAFERSDVTFHQTLARSTHNKLLVATSDLIVGVRHNPEWRKLKDAVRRRNAARREQAVEEHVAIVEALEARNAAQASRRMHKHLDNVRLNLLGY